MRLRAISRTAFSNYARCYSLVNTEYRNYWINLDQDEMALRKLIDNKSSNTQIEELFRKMMNSERGASLFAFQQMVIHYRYCSNLAAIENLKQMMTEQGVKLPERIALELLRAYTDLHAYEKIPPLLLEIEAAGIKFSSKSHKELLMLYARTMNFTQAHQLFEQIPSPDLGVYNCMLKIYLLEGNKVKALEVLEKMKERDILPSAETFGVLINEILGKVKYPPRRFSAKYEQIESLLHLMKHYGLVVHPRDLTALLDFWVKIASKAREDMMEEEEEEGKENAEMNEDFDMKVVDEKIQKLMIECNHVPNIVYFTYLIKYYCGPSPDIGNIQAIFEEMASFDLSPNRFLLHIILTCFVRYSPDNINSVLNLMAYFKIPPNAETYGILMNMRPNTFDQVKKIHEDMKAAKVKPTPVYYDYYLRMAIEKGTDDDVAEILNEMQENNIPMLVSISMRIFKTLLEKKSFNEALQILDNMIQSKPTYAYFNISRLIVELEKLNDVQGIESLLKNFLEHSVNFHPSYIINLLRNYRALGREGTKYSLSLCLYFLRRLRTSFNDDSDTRIVFSIYFFAISTATKMNISAMQSFRDYLQQCGPKLWSEKTQDSFIHLIESIVAANPTTVEKALIPELQKVTAKPSEKKKEPKLNTQILFRE